jgi:hypothetical protein
MTDETKDVGIYQCSDTEVVEAFRKVAEYLEGVHGDKPAAEADTIIIPRDEMATESWVLSVYYYGVHGERPPPKERLN